MEIPKQLRKDEFRFIKIRKGTKRPAEQNWQVDWNYKWDDEEFQKYLKDATAYGVLCGKGHLAVIDCDSRELIERVEDKLPATFTVRTGSGGRHYYYIIPDLKKKIVLRRGEKHYGEIQFSGAQVLGAGSKHPNGRNYKIINNTIIMEIPYKDIEWALGEFMESKFLSNNIAKSGVDLDISKVAATIKGLDRYGENALQGAHPVHGSTNGMNFRIDLDKNLWHCFRCGSGGDTISLIALLEGLVECHELTSGYFKKHPKIFKEALKLAKTKYGYDISKFEDTSKTNNNFDIDILDIAEKIIKENKFIVLSGNTMASAEVAFYHDGYFQKDGVIRLRHIIQQKLGASWNTNKETTIFSYILGKPELRAESQVIRLSKYPNLINFKNGVLDIDTMTIMPHSPDYEFFYQIPHNFNSKAKCPKITKFLKETLEPEFIDFVQEVVGYVFYTDNVIPAIFYLYGSGGNGKTVFSKLLMEAVGKGLYSTKSLTSLTKNRFASYNLYGKLLNISTEEDTDSLVTSFLKELSSGDDTSIEDKGKTAFTYRPVNKIFTACNRIPPAKDRSKAWLQRQYVIPFLKTFRDTKKENMFLIRELTKESELEGFIAWAIQGLKRLLKNKKFSYPYDHEHYYKMATYGVAMYIEDNFKLDYSDEPLFIDDLYAEILEWQGKNKLPPIEKDALIGFCNSRGITLYPEIIDGEKKIVTYKLVRS